jgi:hypothetical protein
MQQRYKKLKIIAAGLILSLTACDLNKPPKALNNELLKELNNKPPKKLNMCTHKIEISDSATANLAVRNTRRQVHKALSNLSSPDLSHVKRRFSEFESTWIEARQFQKSDPYVEHKIIELKTLLNEASPNRKAVLSTFKDLNDRLIPPTIGSDGKSYPGAEGNSDLEWSDETMKPLRDFLVEAKQSVLKGEFFIVDMAISSFEYNWENADAILKNNACRRSSPSEYNAAKVEIKSKLTEFKTLINKYSEREVDIMLGRDSLSRAEKDAALSILKDLNSALNKLGMPDPDS